MKQAAIKAPIPACFMLICFDYSSTLKMEAISFLPNFGRFSANYMALYPRRQNTSYRINVFLFGFLSTFN
jgi:hypothetical protein